jgi:CubicO group peptidase (beta-lactamase class C family)
MQRLSLALIGLALCACADRKPLSAAREPLPRGEFDLFDGRAQERVVEPDARIDTWAQNAMSTQGLVGLGVGVIQNGEISYLRGYGWEDKAAGLPVLSSGTLFRWASMSKMLTAILAVHRLDLDRPIEGYYSEYQPPATYLDKGVQKPLPAGTVITARMLAGHLAGIPHYSNGLGSPAPPSAEMDDPLINTGIEWAMQHLLDKPLVAIPGRTYSYSTFGFNLLGVVLEHAVHQRFYAQALQEIAEPAGMTNLSPDYYWAPQPNRARGYYYDTPTDGDDVSWKLPGGGFQSSVKDLARFCVALTGDKLLSAADKQVAWTTLKDASGAATGYGLGFEVDWRRGRRYVGHSGSQEKTETRLRLYPEERLCLVVMTNSEQASTWRLIEGLEDTVRGED